MENKLKIVVCYHKDWIYIADDRYLPIQVGRINAKEILPIQGDEEGDNISSLNYTYCELTGLYWAWKNIDADYIGLCHYRRYFTFESSIIRGYVHKIYAIIRNLKCAFSSSPVSYSSMHEIEVSDDKILKKKALLASKEINKYLLRHPNIKMIALNPVDMGVLNNYTIFMGVAGKHHIDIIKSIVKEKFPQFYDSFLYVLASSKLNPGDMVICAKNELNQYCIFLFGVLEEHRNKIVTDGWYKDVSEKSLSRLSGYLAEILTSVYIHYIRKEYGRKAVRLLNLLKTSY